MLQQKTIFFLQLVEVEFKLHVCGVIYHILIYRINFLNFFHNHLDHMQTTRGVFSREF